MGWPGERQRHAMSVRGVKTKSEWNINYLTKKAELQDKKLSQLLNEIEDKFEKEHNTKFSFIIGGDRINIDAVLITNKRVPLQIIETKEYINIIESFERTKSPLGWNRIMEIHKDTKIPVKTIVHGISFLLRSRDARMAVNKSGESVYFKIINTKNLKEKLHELAR